MKLLPVSSLHSYEEMSFRQSCRPTTDFKKHRHFRESNHRWDSQQIIHFYETSSSVHNSAEKTINNRVVYVGNLLVVTCD